MASSSPWSALDAATQKKDLYLKPSVISELNSAFAPYQDCLQTLIDDRLDDTTGFGTTANPLAVLLQSTFNACGTTATNYCQQQLSQTEDFVQTANNAATALTHYDTA